jgi:CRP-like cAMP-binding protein
MGIDAFWGNIFTANKTKDTLNILKNIPVFEELKPLELNKLTKILHHREYMQNEIVFREKEPGAGMYIVKSGQIKIILNSLKGEECELARLEKGDFFGEIALIDESPRSATAVALEETELLCFFRADLVNLIDRDPVLSSKILLHLASIVGQRLRQTNKELKRLQNHAKK